jgi:hypothetical protein
MAAADTTASAAPRAAAIEQVPWILVLRVAIGTLFASAFFDNLEKGLYGRAGYANLINLYANDPKNNSPGFWRNGAMPFFAENSSLFAPLQAVFEASLAITLILGLATGMVALLAAGQLTLLWLSELGIFWVWELLSVIIVALVVALATLPRLLDRTRPVGERLLGPPIFRGLSMTRRLGVALAGGVGLALVSLAARTGGSAHYREVALESGVALAVLLAGLGLLDRVRARPTVSRRP